jgi:hypothetical protein
MHASLVNLTIDPAHAAAAAAALMNDILPEITSAPGFVAGYWLEPAEGRGFSVILFDTEEQAVQSMAQTSSWSVPGVTIDDAEVRRVAVAIP